MNALLDAAPGTSLKRLAERILMHAKRIDVVGQSHWLRDLRNETTMARQTLNAGLYAPGIDAAELELDEGLLRYIDRGGQL